MSKILFSSFFAILAFVILAVAFASSTVAAARSANNNNNQQQLEVLHQPARFLRAPKINAKYNLTAKDIKLGSAASTVVGLDLYLPYPSSTWACLQSAGYQFSIVRAWHSYGAPDYSAEINLNNAAAAGIAYRDIYFFPCIGNSNPAAQLREAVRVSPTETWGTLWFDIEQNPSTNCGWSATNFTANCNFLQALIAEGQQLSLQLGLYSSHWEWTQLFGSASYCTAAFDAGLPLWYANYDNQQTFTDFQNFGGYSLSASGSAKVAMKQFTDTTPSCNVIADQNFYPL